MPGEKIAKRFHSMIKTANLRTTTAANGFVMVGNYSPRVEWQFLLQTESAQVVERYSQDLIGQRKELIIRSK